MENIFNYTPELLGNFLVSRGFKKFMANQIIDWVYDKKEYDPNNFLNIKK